MDPHLQAAALALLNGGSIVKNRSLPPYPMQLPDESAHYYQKRLDLWLENSVYANTIANEQLQKLMQQLDSLIDNQPEANNV